MASGSSSTPPAILLVAMLRERPALLPGIAYGHPPGWPSLTNRLLDVWGIDATLPAGASSPPVQIPSTALPDRPSSVRTGPCHLC